MTPHHPEERAELDPAVAKVHASADQGQSPEPDDERQDSFLNRLRHAYRRARDGRRPAESDAKTRTSKSADRSKAFLLLALAVVVMLFVFLGLFSSSSGTRERAAHRTTPNLGRPQATPGSSSETHGSVTPLLSVDSSTPDNGGDQVSPEDVKATARMRQSTQPAAPALASIPPVNDPALDAYRQARAGATPPAQAIVPPATMPAVPSSASQSDPLRKSSLVFVRTATPRSMSAASASIPGPQPVLLERRSSALPSGMRLIARLQAAVSSAVKTPVIATVEYSYEQDGEIVIPAGTKAIGDLQQASRSGDVSIRFHSLQMPDQSVRTIDATALSLSFGPVKGLVSGTNRGKRILTRALTGVGTMAAYVVGGRGGFGGLSGPIDNSMLLRERVASNIGLAGEQELMSLAFNQNVVVTVPGNTRFFIVLQDAAAAPEQRVRPAGNSHQTASSATPVLPTAQELRELIELKNELNRMYREVTATRSTVSPQNP